MQKNKSLVLLPDMSRTMFLCLTGIFSAMFVLLSYFNIAISQLVEIRLSYLALMMAGMIGGPAMGFTTGILGDVLKMLLIPGSGAYFPGFSLCYAIMGFAYGIIFHNHSITVVRAILGALTEFIVSLFGITGCLCIMYGLPWGPTFLSRVPECTVMLFVSAFLIYVLIRSLSVAVRHVPVLHR